MNLDDRLTELREGTRLILNGRYGVVEEATSTHARVRFADAVINVSRRGEDTDLIDVEWPCLLDVNAAALLMDSATHERWVTWKPHNQRRTAARLAMVNLLTTGCRSGFEGILNGEAEPIEELRSGGRPYEDLKGQIHQRALFLERWLGTSQADWVLQLRADWWHTDNPKAPLKQKVPGHRSLERAAAKANEGGIYALCDQRGGDQYEFNETGERRANTEQILDDIIENRTDAMSKKSDEWYVRQAQKEAEQQGKEVLMTGRIRDLVRLKLDTAGRTPSQMRAARFAKERDKFQSRRNWIPGVELAFDQTQGDNLVRMTPNGEPVRPNVHAVADVATGAILGVTATGHYRECNIAMLLYDAARPMVVLPDRNGRSVPRIKGMTRSIIFGNGVFKPGAVGAKYKNDNIVQNHSIFMVGLMNLLGAAIHPSRPGRSGDNPQAETTFKGLAQFFEEADAYVGTHTGNRARGAADDGSLHIKEYEALLQQFAFFDYNHAPSPVPLFKGSGKSRLELWDHLISEYGAPPALLDPNSYFSFLKPHDRILSTKGIRHDDQFFNSEDLAGLPRHVLGPDRVLTYLVDDRQLDCIWVPDPRDGTFYEIPNVLRDLTDAPLTRETAKKARSIAGTTPQSGFHASRAYAHALEQIASMANPPTTIQRSLADMRASWFTYAEVLDAGATVVRGTRGPTDTEDKSDSRTRVPGQPPSSGAPFAHPGPEADTLDDYLDAPIKRDPR